MVASRMRAHSGSSDTALEKRLHFRPISPTEAVTRGLFWELNPGPLAPEARIIPLDQAACAVHVFLPSLWNLLGAFSGMFRPIYVVLRNGGGGVQQNKNAETRDRTGDLQIFGLTLSQLSYRGDGRRAAPDVSKKCKQQKSKRREK